jgi:transcriptional regulator with XRE-family HTH domain
MSELAKSFGARVKVLRAARGLTQPQFGDLIGRSEEWVRRMERGAGTPSFETIERMSSALDVPPASLFVTATDGAFEHLVESAKGLKPAELAWVSELLSLMRRRPD